MDEYGLTVNESPSEETKGADCSSQVQSESVILAPLTTIDSNLASLCLHACGTIAPKELNHFTMRVFKTQYARVPVRSQLRYLFFLPSSSRVSMREHARTRWRVPRWPSRVVNS